MKFFKSKTKIIESEIDQFLDGVMNSGLIFFEGIKAYCEKDFDRFETKNIKIDKIESEADDLRRSIKHKLYTNMLIPESRGDVLGLLETIDEIVDTCEKVLIQFSIEKPVLPEEFLGDFIKLAELSRITTENVIKGSRAFFREIDLVNDYTNKVHFYESEVDEIEDRLKRKIFDLKELDLSHKMHLRYFIEKIAKVSDVSESVAERLAIYTIKRRV